VRNHWDTRDRLRQLTDLPILMLAASEVRAALAAAKQTQRDAVMPGHMCLTCACMTLRSSVALTGAAAGAPHEAAAAAQCGVTL
jgi:hypothetical protein